MKLSDQFEQRFAEMLMHCPTKRSVLVPTLLYMQDEIGYLSDEAIAEMAQRLDLTELEVRNVISYYSMLTTKPRGKYNVQVCTNIACMLRGGEELLRAMCDRMHHRGPDSEGYLLDDGIGLGLVVLWVGSMQILLDRGIEVMPSILCNSGGVTVSYFEWKQNRQAETWRPVVVEGVLRVGGERRAEARTRHDGPRRRVAGHRCSWIAAHTSRVVPGHGNSDRRVQTHFPVCHDSGERFQYG